MKANEVFYHFFNIEIKIGADSGIIQMTIGDDYLDIDSYEYR